MRRCNTVSRARSTGAAPRPGAPDARPEVRSGARE
jgi:hypothetical protein